MFRRPCGALAGLALALLAPAGVRADERADDWKRDLAALSEELVRVHPRFRTCGLPAEVAGLRDALAARVGSLTDAQIVVETQRLLAAVGDGHTLLWPFGMQRGVLGRLPLSLWSFADGLFVVQAADTTLVGRRVVRVGALLPAEALRRVRPFLSVDNENQAAWAAPFYLTLPDVLAAIGAADSPAGATFTFDGSGERRLVASPVDPERLELKLVPPPGAAGSGWLARANEPFYAEEVRPGLLYVAVNAMRDGKGGTLADFGKALRTRLAASRGAVLDLRLNNGGDAARGDELFRSLVAFDASGGRLAILVSRMTFSAAQTVASRLDQWTSAMFVGEPTGSRPNHWGNEREFRLPYSGLRGTISSGWNQPVSARDARTEIAPEIRVDLRSEDYFAGRDPALDAALAALVAEPPAGR